MKAKWMLAASLLLVTSVFAHAGGPPPMYVVVDKVVLDPHSKVPQWVQIYGSFTRMEADKEGKGKFSDSFTKPVYGYVYLAIPGKTGQECREELKDWQKAVGTGKAVAIGSCGDAGSLLTCAIHGPNETVGKADGNYTVGLLKRFGDIYANGQFNKHAEVAALLKFAKERK